MTVYLDLDGTILDTSVRYHRLHAKLLREMGAQPLDPGDYWAAKRMAKSEYQLGIERGLPPGLAKEYAERWTTGVEDAELLHLDQPLHGALEAVASLHSYDRLVLVSLRQYRYRLWEQLTWWGLERLMAAVFSADPRGAAKDVKAELIRMDACFSRQDAVVVGDSEVDMHAGRALEIPTYAVLTGIRCRSLLESCEPTWVGAALKEAVAALLETRRRRIESEYFRGPEPEAVFTSA